MATQNADSDVGLKLALAVVASSTAPLLLLDGDLTVVAASTSFCRAFQFAAVDVPGKELFDLGAGEWDVPQLRSLIRATVDGHAEIEAYEMDLKSERQGTRRVVLNAQKLEYSDQGSVRLLLSIADVTDARLSEKLKDDLLRGKAILLQEIQHRVANSLQIIASVLMQSARRVQSSETRGHLHDAHNRVMSIASVQRQLASSQLGDVQLRPYLTQLCESLGASMISDRNRLSIDVTVDDSSVPAEASISIGLIVTELVINALKYAFPQRRKGKIIVGYHADQDQGWTLSVSDNGVGFPVDGNSAKAGLGTVIVEALSKSLFADVKVRDAEPGTAVTMVHVAPVTFAREPTALRAV